MAPFSSRALKLKHQNTADACIFRYKHAKAAMPAQVMNCRLSSSVPISIYCNTYNKMSDTKKCMKINYTNKTASRVEVVICPFFQTVNLV